MAASLARAARLGPTRWSSQASSLRGSFAKPPAAYAATTTKTMVMVMMTRRQLHLSQPCAGRTIVKTPLNTLMVSKLSQYPLHRRFSSSQLRLDDQAPSATKATQSAATTNVTHGTPPHSSQRHRKTFSIRPYMALSRIDKPIGSWLLYWPCAWSLTLCATSLALPLSTLLFNLSIFAVGAFVMRGAGCTINDMWDARMDRMVERTKHRPLAAGDVTYFQAWSFLGLQLSAGLGVLLQLNWYSILLGASSLSLVVIYPLMKRITYWPQLVLGLAFNWGALLGWAALSAPPMWSATVPLYAGSICWTLVYDTIYAHQDKSDDVYAGVKSTALLFAHRTRPILTTFSIGFLSLLTTSVALSTSTTTTTSTSLLSTFPSLLLTALASLPTTHPFFLFLSLPLVASHLTWQIRSTDFDSRPDCWRKFCSNQWLGFALWLGLMLDYLWCVWMPASSSSQEVSTEEEHGAEAEGKRVEDHGTEKVSEIQQAVRT